MKNAMIYIVILCVGMAIAWVFLQGSGKEEPETAAAPTQTAEEGYCEEHKIAEAKCPWCKPSLIEEMGECGGHKVPEALCSRCNKELIAGFKAENDWCAGHEVPESQCTVCLGETDACEDDKEDGKKDA